MKTTNNFNSKPKASINILSESVVDNFASLITSHRLTELCELLIAKGFVYEEIKTNAIFLKYKNSDSTILIKLDNLNDYPSVYTREENTNGVYYTNSFYASDNKLNCKNLFDQIVASFKTTFNGKAIYLGPIKEGRSLFNNQTAWQFEFDLKTNIMYTYYCKQFNHLHHQISKGLKFKINDNVDFKLKLFITQLYFKISRIRFNSDLLEDENFSFLLLHLYDEWILNIETDSNNATVKPNFKEKNELLNQFYSELLLINKLIDNNRSYTGNSALLTYIFGEYLNNETAIHLQQILSVEVPMCYKMIVTSWNIKYVAIDFESIINSTAEEVYYYHMVESRNLSCPILVQCLATKAMIYPSEECHFDRDLFTFRKINKITFN